MTDRVLLTWNIIMMVVLVGLGVYVHQQRQGYFAQVPVEKVHTMRMWEDGSFEIVYQDNTSEIGCVPGGLCND